ncbi:hypothetical protein [Pseudopelagicola sp. nBUS_19]|uniref:hypothetical protein n=1 Tax=Pseudopelagicola sp. nBUS_19 TaxID=3395316 RepID=UPI003EC141A2
MSLTGLHAHQRFAALAHLISVVCTVLAVVVVNYMIYTVRWQFAELHPEYVIIQPATISRAISDPLIGNPFAMWMLICAPMLFVSELIMFGSFIRELKRAGVIPSARVQKIGRVTAIVITLQGLASTGMILLSQFRFPEYNDMHMFGSYLFFFSQAFAIFTMAFLSRCYDRLAPLPGTPLPVMGRIRLSLIAVPLLLSVFYLGLFLIKESISDPWRDLVYQTYVTVELLLCSSFLVYLLAWVPDSLLAARTYLRF